MTHLWTIIGVADVGRSFGWYQSLLGLPAGRPAHDYFGTIEEGGRVLLFLHRWGDHGHPPLAGPDRGGPGNGLLLFFRVDDFDGALSRARPGRRARGGAARQSQYRHHGVRAAGPGRLLRHGQRARGGRNIRSSGMKAGNPMNDQFGYKASASAEILDASAEVAA